MKKERKSNTIKELVCKYKEKVFELEEIKNIYEASRMQIQQIKNYRILHCNSSVGSNVATNSNSYDNSYDNNEEENNVKNIILLYLKDDDTGKDIANILELVGITANKNTVPNDPQSPFVTSGIRLGVPAMSTRGLKEEDMVEIGKIIASAVTISDMENNI